MNGKLLSAIKTGLLCAALLPLISNGQDSLCPPVKQSGAQQITALQDEQRAIVRFLQENRGWVGIQQEYNGYALYKGYPVNVYGNNNAFFLVFLKDQKKQLTDTLMVPYAGVMDEQIRILSSNSNIQLGSGGTDYRLKLGNCVFSLRENLTLARYFRDQLLHYQQDYHNWYFNVDSFALNACLYKRMGIKKEIPELQHKYMIQAMTCAKLGRYQQAIGLLEYAIMQSPFTSADNYQNLAVLYAETGRLHSAVYMIRRFLLLSEDKEALKKAAQQQADWETILNN